MSDYRVGSVLVMSSQTRMISINVQSWTLPFRSCLVASTILIVHRQMNTLTGLLHAYPFASHSTLTSPIQMHAI